MRKQQKRQKEKKNAPIQEKYLQRLWKNIHSDLGLSSLSYFAKSLKSGNKLADIERSLSKIQGFALHRPLRRSYPTPAIITKEIGELYCCDVAHLEDLAPFNKGYRFLFICLDNYSKLLTAIPMKRQKGEDIAQALEKSFKDLYGAPQMLLSDKGTNLLSKEAKAVYEKYGIKHITSQSLKKSAPAENQIKFLKGRIYKFITLKKSKTYINALPTILKGINNRVHASTQMVPAKINKSNQGEIFVNLFSRLIKRPVKEEKFKVGDKVYLARERLTFTKGYKQGFNKTVLTIAGIKNTYPVKSYVLKFQNGELVPSSYVKSELSFA